MYARLRRVDLRACVYVRIVFIIIVKRQQRVRPIERERVRVCVRTNERVRIASRILEYVGHATTP